MFMIILVLNNPDQCPFVLNAWAEAGAPGVTVLPSTGLGRIQAKMGLHDDVPLMPSLEDFLQEEEGTHRTLIVIVRERAIVDRIIHATQEILGDLNRPHIGILAVLPVLEVYGLDRYNE
jgi:nitrogen regulatory protein PII